VSANQNVSQKAEAYANIHFQVALYASLTILTISPVYLAGVLVVKICFVSGRLVGHRKIMISASQAVPANCTMKNA
jgi:hypothetical protein